MIHYPEREAIKSEAWKVLHDLGATLRAQAQALLCGLITAHYWRAREQLCKTSVAFRKKVFGKSYTSKRVLEFGEYAQHWLGARPPGDGVGEEVIREVTRLWAYSPKPHRMLPVGHSSYWDRRGDV